MKTKTVKFEHIIVGEPQGVHNALARYEGSGHLLELREIIRRPDGRAEAHALFQGTRREQRALQSPAARRITRWRIAGYTTGAVVALGAISALVFLIYQAGLWVTAHWHAIVAGLVVLAVLLLAAGGAVAKHCPGCRG